MTKSDLTIYIRVKITLILITIVVFASFSQSSVGIGTVAPHISALLELSSINKGFLPTRMSETQMYAINNPAEGLIIYCLDCTPKGVYIYDDDDNDDNDDFRMLQFFENPVKYLYIDDVSVTAVDTSFDISPTLIPTEATVNYELITNLSGVSINETTVSIPEDMGIGEHTIVVKATGTEDYNGEIRATFKLDIIGIPLRRFSIDDVSVAKGETSFDISPTLIPTEATVNYELITNLSGVSISTDGTVSIPANMAIGEYNITVKARGTGDYTREIEATFKLDITHIALRELSIDDVSIPIGTTSFVISPTLTPSGATVDYSLIDPPIGGSISTDGTTVSIPADMGIGEYNITVKARGTGDYNEETGATFKLDITHIALRGFSIDDVNIPIGDTSFDISPTLTPTGATVDYELITNLREVYISGTTVSIPRDMNAGEYRITVKATGTGGYNGEIRTTFKLDIMGIALRGFSIDDVSVPRGDTSFDISPTLIPSEATVNYELITNLSGVFINGTTVSIPRDMNYGEYSIVVKATGTGDYTREIETILKLDIRSFPLRGFSIDDVNIPMGTTSFDISPALTPSGATVNYSLISPPGVSINGTTVSIPADMTIGEYNITVKARGTGGYNGEIRTTFKLLKWTSPTCFTFSSEGMITSYNCNYTNVVIPSIINDRSVTGIGGGAFMDKRLTSVIIPNSVTSIGSSAFLNNLLTSVIIPNSVTSIGDIAFQNNLLTSVIIPNSVTSIGLRVFYYNKLTSVIIPNSVTSINFGAFDHNQLTSVTIPNSVTSIKKDAFRNNRLTSVTIPNSVTHIEEYAFNNNQLTSVIMPNSVTHIGEHAFSYNRLRAAVISNSLTSIEGRTFRNNQLVYVIIPDSVTHIGSYAFANNQMVVVTINQGTTYEHDLHNSFDDTCTEENFCIRFR